MSNFCGTLPRKGSIDFAQPLLHGHKIFTGPGSHAIQRDAPQEDYLSPIPYLYKCIGKDLLSDNQKILALRHSKTIIS